MRVFEALLNDSNLRLLRCARRDDVLNGLMVIGHTGYALRDCCALLFYAGIGERIRDPNERNAAGEDTHTTTNQRAVRLVNVPVETEARRPHYASIRNVARVNTEVF